MKPLKSLLANKKEILQKPDPSLAFVLLSYEKLESFVRVKEQCEKNFGKVLMESKTFPRWVLDPSEKGHTMVGSNTKVLSFVRKIGRESLVAFKKKCILIREKLYSKDPTLRILPGYLSSHNVIFTSTIDDYHRVYLDEGVFAEVIYKYEKLKLRHITSAPEFFSYTDVQFFFTMQRDAYLKSL
ncbi:MAG: DUF4416 family protein [Spirochaetota bacterium]